MNVAHPKITTHGFSHIGQRDENQDRLAILESPDDGSRLLVVADGLGGHTGGLLAAETIVATAERCWCSCYPEQSPDGFLKLLVRECHNAVRRAGREQGLDAHSTIAALLFQDGQAISVHVGDSRVMQYSERSFIDRTLDHSIAQLHALRGTITDDEIAEHPDQNKLFAQVGGPTAPEAEIKRWDLSEGRWFVLCSDGFWEIFRHDEIVKLFMSDDPEAELKNRFERKLRQLKHHDNTTAILAEVTPGEAVPDELTPADATPAYVPWLRRANLRQTTSAPCAPSPKTRPTSPGVRGRGRGRRDSGGNPCSPQPSPPKTRPAGPGEDIADAVAEELRQRGQLGADDSLANVGGSPELGETTVLRMRQEHRGIPVFAAEVVVSTLGGRIVRIAGDSTSDIRLDSTVPINDYSRTIALAEILTGLTITPQDDGALVVFPADNGGRLAWSGPAIVEQGLEPDPVELPEQNPAQSVEQVYLDAVNGEVLLRLPLVRQVLDRRIYDFSQACRDAGIRSPDERAHGNGTSTDTDPGIAACPIRSDRRVAPRCGTPVRYVWCVLSVSSPDSGHRQYRQ